MTDIFELLKGKQNSKGNFQKQPVIVQGITGKYGTRHTKLMIEYGTNIVAGVTPGKGGQKFENSVPIYETVKEAVDKTGAKISIMFVPAKFFLDAAKDALEAGIKLLIAIPEHVPVQDTMIPILINSGIITPGVLGPMTIASFCFASLTIFIASCTGTCSGIATSSCIPASNASFAAPKKNLAGTNMIEIFAPVLSTASLAVS